MYFIPQPSQNCTNNHDLETPTAIGCTSFAEDPFVAKGKGCMNLEGRRLFSTGLTLGEYSNFAKLQKEHAEGHTSLML